MPPPQEIRPLLKDYNYKLPFSQEGLFGVALGLRFPWNTFDKNQILLACPSAGWQTSTENRHLGISVVGPKKLMTKFLEPKKTSIMGNCLKGNWCCFQVLGRETSIHSWLSFLRLRGRTYLQIGHQNTRDTWSTSGFSMNILIEGIGYFLNNYHKISSSKLNLANLFLGTPKGRFFFRTQHLMSSRTHWSPHVIWRQNSSPPNI